MADKEKKVRAGGLKASEEEQIKFDFGKNPLRKVHEHSELCPPEHLKEKPKQKGQ